MSYEVEKIENSIAYCGLICKMCHLSSTCQGCKSDFGCEEWKDCVHRKCCIEKNINGCWECEEAPCDKKMFANGHDIRIRAFIKFMKEESPKKLIECIIENEKRGIKYGYHKDYDLKKSEEEVIALLLEGAVSIESKRNPYEKCPTYETEQYIIRRVEEKDAKDLLECYSDHEAEKLFNSDNCTSNFIYKSLEEMKQCIMLWMEHYHSKYYVRFSIIDKRYEKAIGTIEFFAKPVNYNGIFKVGLLRLDLATKYENVKTIEEILDLVNHNFYYDFEVKHIITKAIPIAKQRIVALNDKEYKKLQDKTIVPYNSYFIRDESV
jgi:hypothetical protein